MLGNYEILPVFSVHMIIGSIQFNKQTEGIMVNAYAAVECGYIIIFDFPQFCTRVLAAYLARFLLLHTLADA